MNKLMQKKKIKIIKIGMINKRLKKEKKEKKAKKEKKKLTIKFQFIHQIHVFLKIIKQKKYFIKLKLLVRLKFTMVIFMNFR
jgi:hypothetical protein